VTRVLTKGYIDVQFTTEVTEIGLTERKFTLDDVTGVLWSPAGGSGGGPLILMGHSGGLHKKARGILTRTFHYVTQYGFTVAAIDAPGHGDRPRNARDERWVNAMMEAWEVGEPIAPIVEEYNTSLAERAVPEWQATLDALLAQPEIGREAPVGYGGTTLGTAIGLTLVAAEPRIAAATFGAVLVYDALVEAARRITIPVEFVLPWDDEQIKREPGLALFDACASLEKVLHVYPGEHDSTPGFTIDDSARFFLRHLGPGAKQTA
jgi:dienelactone hydrolase